MDNYFLINGLNVLDIFSDGLAWVQLNNKYNFINTNGKLISNQWFDDIYNFFQWFCQGSIK